MSQTISSTNESTTSQVQVKSSHPNLLLNVLNSLDNNEIQKTIAKNNNVSKQLISYHIMRFKAKGLIEQVTSKPIATFKLTNKGRQVKEFYAQSVNSPSKKLWRVHALILGYRVETWGLWNFSEQLLKPMRGWKFQELYIKDHKIHMQTSNLLKIYIPEHYTNNPTLTLANMYEEGNKVANHIAQRYNMKIKPMHIVREAHKELQGTEKLARLLGTQKIGNVRIDFSEKDKPNLEEDQSAYDLEKLLDLPDDLQEIKENQKFLIESMSILKGYQDQIRLHLEVEQRTNKTLEEMEETNKDIRDAIRELRDNIKSISETRNA